MNFGGPRNHEKETSLTSRLWLFLLLATVVGCTDSPSRPTHLSLVGDWGGDHVHLVIGPTSSHLEFDCAHGDIPTALMADSDAVLSAAGTFVREHGGPIRVDEPLDAHPALYAGTLSGGTLRLTVRLIDINELIGTFTLTRGAVGRVVKCL